MTLFLTSKGSRRTTDFPSGFPRPRDFLRDFPFGPPQARTRSVRLASSRPNSALPDVAPWLIVNTVWPTRDTSVSNLSPRPALRGGLLARLGLSPWPCAAGACVAARRVSPPMACACAAGSGPAAATLAITIAHWARRPVHSTGAGSGCTPSRIETIMVRMECALRVAAVSPLWAARAIAPDR